MRIASAVLPTFGKVYLHTQSPDPDSSDRYEYQGRLKLNWWRAYPVRYLVQKTEDKHHYGDHIFNILLEAPQIFETDPLPVGSFRFYKGTHYQAGLGINPLNTSHFTIKHADRDLLLKQLSTLYQQISEDLGNIYKQICKQVENRKFPLDEPTKTVDEPTKTVDEPPEPDEKYKQLQLFDV